jgi:hypothetical protein
MDPNVTIVEHPDAEEISPMDAEQQEEQDTEIQDVAAEITAMLQEAFAILIDRRNTAYTAAIAALNSEQEELTAEHTSIEAAAVSLEVLLAAKASARDLGEERSRRF